MKRLKDHKVDLQKGGFDDSVYQVENMIDSLS